MAKDWRDIAVAGKLATLREHLIQKVPISEVGGEKSPSTFGTGSNGTLGPTLL